MFPQETTAQHAMTEQCYFYDLSQQQRETQERLHFVNKVLFQLISVTVVTFILTT